MEQLVLPVAVHGMKTFVVCPFILLVSIGDILVGRQYIDVLAGFIKRETCGEVNLGPTALTLLGGDEYNTVRGT